MCKDGYMLAGATNDLAWQRFCRSLGCEELASDPRFQTNNDRVAHRSALIPLLEARFKEDTVSEWVSRFEKNGVAVSPLLEMKEVMTHTQVIANDMVVLAKTSEGSSEEHTSELQSLRRSSYAVFCLKPDLIYMIKYHIIL